MRDLCEPSLSDPGLPVRLEAPLQEARDGVCLAAALAPEPHPEPGTQQPAADTC